MRMTPDSDESIRCTASTCSCVSFKPGSVQLRSCDRCGHSWVAHALEKLQFQAPPPSSCGPVEVALPGLVFDLSSLVLYGAQAIPVRLKILLDRLYSVLTPEQVGHILHTLGWSLGDYVRGYMLQLPNGKVLDRWLMVTPKEELLILKQFLRFGETRPIVEVMTLQCQEPLNNFPNQELNPIPKVNISSFMERNTVTPGELKTRRGYSSLTADICHLKKNCPPDLNNNVHRLENFPGRMSLLLPFHFPNSTFHFPTKELDHPSKVTFKWKSSNSKQSVRHRQEGFGRQQNDQEPKNEPRIKIKADPDKPNLSQPIGLQPPWLPDRNYDPQRSISNQEDTSSPSPSIRSSFISTSSPVAPSLLHSPPKIPQNLQGSPHSLSPLPSFSSSFLCPSSFSSSLHPLPSSLCTLPSLSPAGGRKGRVCCGVCGKSFYDKGTLKIHYNAVHLKIKHRCTVAGCSMVFSSLRSRNRHSANPNPRLHTGTSREVRQANTDPHSSMHLESMVHRNARKNLHNAQICRMKEIGNTLWQPDDSAHKQTLKNDFICYESEQRGCQGSTPPPANSPPPSLLPLCHDANQSSALTDSAHRSNLPPLLPAQNPSSLSSHSSLISLDEPATQEVTECFQYSGLLHPNRRPPASLPNLTPASISSFSGEPESLLDQTKACISPLTSEPRRWDSGDPIPKKKPRKSSMPVKIEREMMEMGRMKDEEDC